MRKAISSLVMALVLCWSGAVYAGDFQSGLDAYTAGDYATALREWRDLAEQGDARAQNNLGNMYDMGKGVTQDYAEALKWRRLAADQGYAEAQITLGNMYFYGLGVTQDFVAAHMWFSIAAASGDAGAANIRELIAILMTPDQISEAQKLAREWMAKHQGQ